MARSFQLIGEEMIRTIFSCDQCGVEKKESNHWVLAYRIRGHLLFVPWATDPDTLPLQYNSEVYHLCGEGCSARLLSADIFSWHQEYHTKKITDERPSVSTVN